MKTRDIDIRSQLNTNLLDEHRSDPHTLVIHELGLCQGDARVDVAVINGSIHGYEIKSESDTLERLPGQVEVYSKVLDSVTVITGECHCKNVLKLVPEWWGIELTEVINDNAINFITLRQSFDNPSVDPYSLVQLLWRDEALDLLKKFGLEKGFLSKPRNQIWEKLAGSFSIFDLKYYIREQLKNRKNWRVD